MVIHSTKFGKYRSNTVKNVPPVMNFNRRTSKLQYNELKPMLTMDLDNNDIGIAFSIGCFDQTVTVIDQQFIFSKDWGW